MLCVDTYTYTFLWILFKIEMVAKPCCDILNVAQYYRFSQCCKSSQESLVCVLFTIKMSWKLAEPGLDYNRVSC